MKTAPENRDEAGLRPEQITALRDISTIRDKKKEHDKNRLEAFNDRAKESDVSSKINAELTTIHPDGIVTQHVSTPEELAKGLAAMYADGHGDFGLYDFMFQEPERDEKGLER